MAQRILIIDDDALLSQSLAITLRDKGYEAATADSGETAMALARRERPHLIVLDVMMPGLDGLAVLSLLKNDAVLAATPVIMLTSQRASEHVLRARDLGAAAYVAKPIDSEYLLARIRLVLAPPAASRDQSVLRAAPGVAVEWLD